MQTWGTAGFGLCAGGVDAGEPGNDNAAVTQRRVKRGCVREIRMRAITIGGLVLLAAVVVGAGHNTPPLDVRLGLWEISRTTASSGEIRIPAGLLEKLTPEQRTRLDERMKARSSATRKQITRKYCLTAARMNLGIPFDQERKNCTRTVVSSTRTQIEVHARCMDGSLQTDAIFRIERLNSENVKGDWQTVSNDGNRDSSWTFTAKWICQSCDGTK